MRPTPFPHQIEAARFLADRRTALLADEPRVGKTGAAIMAADYILAQNVLVITTASGRANMGREWGQWQEVHRTIQVVYDTSGRIPLNADVVVIAWSIVTSEPVLAQLHKRKWDVLILDESHYAKGLSKRTAAAFGLVPRAANVWCLTGTPTPNGDPRELYPALRFLAPDRLGGLSYEQFEHRFCQMGISYASGRPRPVFREGKNLDELRQRLDGWWLRRTQQDVGIREPIYALYGLHVSDFNKAFVEQASAIAGTVVDDILTAAEMGDTAFLELHLGPLRRVTGLLKARAVAAAIAEELEDGGLDKIVLMAWHTSVIDALRQELFGHGVVGIDGRTPANARQGIVDDFTKGSARVFVGQIQACGEAIDLSAACNLMFVEPSFSPKDMHQAALRITNHNQRRQCVVRFAALTGSIDEAVMAVLARKVATIKEIWAHAS